ncbi:MAG: DnaJ domain [Pseudomonadota bacterium]|jgi:hypothetical protein
MVSGSTSGAGNSSSAWRDLTEKCLQLVLACSSSGHPQPQDVSGLKVLRDSLDSIIKKYEAAPPAQDADSRAERVAQPFSKNKESVSQQTFVIEDEPVSDEDASPQSKFWRSKRRSQSERDEKKARLEKREEILRDLRARVSGFRSEFDDPPASSSDCPSGRETSKMTFEVYAQRIQRASYWPRGTPDWARQLLGVERGMTPAEKRQCYLDMVKVCHPDHNPSARPDAMQDVNEAWDILRTQE